MNLTPQIWHGCYDKSLKGFITDASFNHPAKFSLGLIERIYDHCLARGYFTKGSLVGDVFGGVAIGGLVAAYRGVRWIGCELEPKFVGFCRQNIALHRSKLEYLGCPLPLIIQGDSRFFAERVQAVVSSPPYAETETTAGNVGNATNKSWGKGKRLASSTEGYGREDGQIGRLKSCAVDSVIASPPYAAISTGAGGLNTNPAKHEGQQSGRSAKAASQDTDQKYGTSDGQIARLKGGDVQAVVTSPPFEDSLNVRPSKQILNGSGGRMGQSCKGEDNYGTAEGQIGNSKGETYWQAMDQVYRSCFQAIRPGGVIVLVVKNYVKNRKIVPLCDDTVRLLEHIGFMPLERIRAMLKTKTVHNDLFHKEGVTTIKSRASFFRRLAEQKGAPPIDWEEVIICQKPALTVEQNSEAERLQSGASVVQPDNATLSDSESPQRLL